MFLPFASQNFAWHGTFPWNILYCAMFFGGTVFQYGHANKASFELNCVPGCWGGLRRKHVLRVQVGSGRGKGWWWRGAGGSFRAEREGEAWMLKHQRTTTALWEPAQKSKHSIKRQEVSLSAQKTEPSLFRAQRKRVWERSSGLYRERTEQRKKRGNVKLICVHLLWSASKWTDKICDNINSEITS